MCSSKIFHKQGTLIYLSNRIFNFLGEISLFVSLAAIISPEIDTWSTNGSIHCKVSKVV